MLDMGFQPQVDRIVERLPGDRQTMFFSATLDGLVGNIARAYTRDPVRHEEQEKRLVIQGAEHRFVPVGANDKLERLIEVLREKRELALVFVRTKRGADRLHAKLRAKGVSALALHGDMNQAARKRAMDRFATGDVDVMIATDVAARGLDVDGITHVINFDPPGDHKDYVHRVGRTARAGRFGTGVTFVTPDHQDEVSRIARALELKAQFQTEGLVLAAPQRVFSSHGRRSMMRKRQKRRF
jgi:ATP-dependent RNA helicase RhlE